MVPGLWGRSLAPIRAKKLRYYEDRNFTVRQLPAPALSLSGFQDRPVLRPNDWEGQVRATDQRMLAPVIGDNDDAESAGGLQQQMLPEIQARGTSWGPLIFKDLISFAG